MYLRWSVLPFAVMLLSLPLVSVNLYLFAVTILTIRLIWFFAAARIVPMDAVPGLVRPETRK